MQRQFDPFTVVQQSQNRAAKLTKDFQEQGALDTILNEAMSSNDPDVLNQTLAKVISQVSPEKQAMAGQLIQNKMADIAKKKQTALELQAAKQGGYDPYAPAGVKTQQVKDKNKNERLKSSYGNNVAGNQNDSTNLPVSQMSNREQLINLSGHPDKEVSEPAKARLKDLQKRETEDRADKREFSSLMKKDIYKTESEDLPRYKSAQQNIVRIKDLSKNLTGFSGYRKALFNTSEAAEFNTLGASLLEPVIKVFNPSGALPTAKLNWIKDQFQPRALELSSTIQGKISTMERLNSQAIQRAEDKINLFKNFNNNPPESEIMKFDQQSEKIINDIVDEGMLGKVLQEETPKGKVLMFDPDGNALHVDPNEKAQNGMPIIDYYLQNGATLKNE